MSSIFTKIALAALVSLGGMGAASQASAAQVDVVVRTPNLVIRTPQVVRRPVVVVRQAPVVIIKPAGRCQPGVALAKASRHGLNRVAISHIGPNRVTVTGRTRGMWAKMVFANVRGCPRL